MGYLFKSLRNCETQFANLKPRVLKRVFRLLKVYTLLVGVQKSVILVKSLAVSYKVTHTHTHTHTHTLEYYSAMRKKGNLAICESMGET